MWPLCLEFQVHEILGFQMSLVMGWRWIQCVGIAPEFLPITSCCHCEFCERACLSEMMVLGPACRAGNRGEVLEAPSSSAEEVK